MRFSPREDIDCLDERLRVADAATEHLFPARDGKRRRAAISYSTGG